MTRTLAFSLALHHPHSLDEPATNYAASCYIRFHFEGSTKKIIEAHIEHFFDSLVGRTIRRRLRPPHATQHPQDAGPGADSCLRKRKPGKRRQRKQGVSPAKSRGKKRGVFRLWAGGSCSIALLAHASKPFSCICINASSSPTFLFTNPDKIERQPEPILVLRSHHRRSHRRD